MITSEELRKSFKYLFPDELPALKSLALSLPPMPIIVNIGAGSGTSGLAFLEARSDATLLTIDIEDRDSPFGSLFSERVVMKEAGLDHLDGIQWFQVRGDSKNVGNEWTKPISKRFYRFPDFSTFKIDLIFIDGDHEDENPWGDIVIWKQHIRKGGILAVHDYQKERLFHDDDSEEFIKDRPHPQPWPDVNRAVDGLLVGKYEVILQVDSLIAFRM